MSQASQELPIMSVRDALFIFFYKGRVFAAIFFAVYATLVFYGLFGTPIYKASGQLIVKPPIDRPVMFSADEVKTYPMPIVTPQDINTVIYLLTSDDVLRPVVRKLGDEPPPEGGIKYVIFVARGYVRDGIRWLKYDVLGLDEPDYESLKVDALRDIVNIEPLTPSNLIEVSIKDDDPQKITATVNALFESYIEKHNQVNQLQGSQQFFNEQITKYRQDIAKSQEELSNLKKQWDIISVDDQRLNNLEILKQLQLKRGDVNDQLLGLTSRTSSYEGAIQQGRQLTMENTGSHSGVSEMERQSIQARIDLETARSKYLPGSEPVKAAEQRYAALQGQLRDQMSTSLATAKLDATALKTQLDEVDAQIAKVKEENAFLTEKQDTIQRMEFELNQKSDNFKLYLQRSEEVRINEEKGRHNIANVAIASPAIVPDKPWFPRLGLMIILGLPFAFLLALGGTIAAYILDDSIKLPQDIKRQTGLDALGSFDAMPEGAH